MKKIAVLLLSFALTSALMAQQATKTDSIYLTLYNTGGKYLLKRAVYGEQTPKVAIIKDMVLTKDSFVVKTTKLDAGFKPKTSAEMKVFLPTSKTPPAPVKPAQADIDKAKNNAARRTCIISQKDLKDKIVLIDYDLYCDQSEKCLQAQKAGAAAIIVIFDATKKDNDKLESEGFDDDLKIPVYSVSTKVGDTIRAHLPSKAALWVKGSIPVNPKPLISLPTDSTKLKKIDNVLVATALDSNKIAVTDAAQFLSTNKNFSVSPNPANGYVTVNYSVENAASVRITLINEGGAEVYTQKNSGSSGSHTIDTKSLGVGIYLCAIDTGGTLVHMQKINIVH